MASLAMVSIIAKAWLLPKLPDAKSSARLSAAMDKRLAAAIALLRSSAKAAAWMAEFGGAHKPTPREAAAGGAGKFAGGAPFFATFAQSIPVRSAAHAPVRSPQKTKK